MKLQKLFFVLFLSMVTSVIGQNSDPWKTVDSLMKKQRYSQAYDKAEKLYDAAVKKGDSRQSLIGAHYLALAGEEYRENNVDSSLARYEALLPRLDAVDQAICRMFVAEYYATYYKNNQWRINQNEKTDQDELDIALWDADRFRSHVERLVREALSDVNTLQNTKSEGLKYLTEKHNGKNANLTPTLYDILVDEAFVVVKGMKYNLADGSGDSFMDYMFSQWKKREDFHRKNGGDDVQIELFRRGLELRQMLSSEECNVEKELRDAIKSYEKRGDVHVAMLYSDLVDYLRSKERLKEAVAVADSAIMLFPKTPGADECHNVIQMIKRPDIGVRMQEIIPVDRHELIRVTATNVTHLYFRVINFFGTDFWDDSESKRQKMLSKPVVAQWDQSLEKHDDYKSHESYTLMPKMKQGHYYLLVSHSADFKKEAINILDFNVHEYALLAAKEDGNHQKGFLVNRATGKPVAGKNVELQYSDRKSDKYSTFAIVVTDKDGYYDFTGKTKKGYYGYRIVVRENGNELTVKKWGSLDDDGEDKENKQLDLFFDRPVYKPGDTVRFSYLQYTKSFYEANVVKDITVGFELLDINHKKISKLELMTDDFGTCSGSFVLPADAMPGMWFISSKTEALKYWSFKVEAYKQPKFMVQLDAVAEERAFGKTAHVEGVAASYSAVPISNAIVTYRVIRREKCPSWRWGWQWWWHSSLSETIADGYLTTDEKGQFTIEFITQPADRRDNYGSEKPVYEYIVNAKVTDINGETHEATTSFAVGFENRYIDIAEKQLTSDDVNVEVSCRNLDGVAIDGEVKIEVLKLKMPDKPLLTHPLFEKKESYKIVGIDREEFEKKMPLFDYDGSATDYSKWNKEKTLLESNVTIGKEQPYKYTFAGMAAGVYKIVATSKGANGDTLRSEHYVVFQPKKSKQPVTSDLLVVNVNQTKCRVGDTLRVNIGSRFDDVTVYLVVNKVIGYKKNVIHQHYQRKVSAGWTEIEIPVTETMRGGVTLDVAAVKEGCISNRSMNIDVPFAEKELNVEFVTFRNKLEPGNNELWTIKVKKANDLTSVDANLLMTMYDHAIDNYGNLNWDYRSIQWRQYHSARCFGSIANLESGFSHFEPSMNILNVKLYDFTYFTLVNDQRDYLYGGIRMYKNSRAMSATARGEDGNIAVTTELEVVENDVEIENELGIVATVAGVAAEADGAEEEAVYNIENSDNKEHGENNDESHLRSNLNTLAFFKPTLRTDENGVAEVSFTVPDLLTEWSIKGLAWTKDLQIGTLSASAITQKRLMAVPNVPRFLRQGDTCIFSVKVSNMSEQRQDVTVTLEMTDAATGQVIDMITDDLDKHITLEPSTSGQVSFRLAVPDYNLFVTNYKVMAYGQGCSDGEQSAIPILPNRQMVTESMAFYINGAGEKHYEMEHLVSLDFDKNSTLKPYSLTVDLTPNPLWMAIQSLPYVSQKSNPSNIFLANSIYANSLSLSIVKNNPAIEEIFNEWEQYDRDAFMSELDRNSDIKQIVMEETPWLRDAKQEEQRHRDIARFFNKTTLNYQLSKEIDKLLNAQRSDGSWSWIEGCKWPSLYTTQYILKTLGLLRQQGVELDRRTTNALNKAMDYVDRETYDYYKKYIKGKGHNYDVVNLDYLYLRSLYPSNKLSKKQQEAYDFFYNNAKKYNEEYRSLYTQALLSVVFYRHGDKRLAQDMAVRIKEKALYSDEMGMYWRDNTSGWFWYQRPIETQAMLIRTFAEVLNDGESVAKMQQWLLKQKQTTNWNTDVSTVNAIQALLFNGTKTSQSNVQSLAPTEIRLTFGSHTLQTDTSRHQLHISSKLDGNEITNADGNLTIRKADDGIAWGAMYYQYFEQIDKIPASNMGVTIRRSLYKVASDGSFKPLSSNSLHVGDKVHVRIEITTDRNLEYLELKDPRCAAFEPVSTASGWRWSDGLSYYLSVTNTAQTLYIDRLDKGGYYVEYDLYVNNAGKYLTAPTTMQCLYAPEFRALCPAESVTVN